MCNPDKKSKLAATAAQQHSHSLAQIKKIPPAKGRWDIIYLDSLQVSGHYYDSENLRRRLRY